MKWRKSCNKPVLVGDDVLVYDIETDGLDTETAKLKWFGAFSFKDNCYYFYTYHEMEHIQKLIDDHKICVGYNNKDFDQPICENNGLSFEYKIRIDLLRVLFRPETRTPVREAILKVDGQILKNVLPNHKLKSVAKALKLDQGKGDIDYKIFRKDYWTKSEIKEILHYLHLDVKITKEIFEYMYKEFLPMKYLMGPEDQRKYNWFRTSTGSYTYKVICHQAGIEEEYAEPGPRKQFEGGFVSDPLGHEFKGKIYCLDFNSAYPHAFMMGNLYSHSCKCCTEDEKWAGNELFPVEGRYCMKKPGKVERVIKKLYLQRLEYKKKKDPREYAIKIIINTMYGISGSQVFKNVYSLNTASDCTLMARQMVKHARNKFECAGYKVLYSDTDSVFLLDTYNNETNVLRVRDEIITDIKNSVPFPQDTFGMGIDARIKAAWFFKKKHYVYITEENKIKIKGLPLIKSDCSRLSRLVFERLKPDMIDRLDIKYPLFKLKEIVKEILDEDLGLVANYYKVRRPETYKSQTSIQYQIAKELGPGEHWLVPNRKIGSIGKGKKYCTLEEAKSLEVDDLILDKVWETELSPFIK